MTRRAPGAWHLYIVECADGSLYIGATTDMTRRLAEHNAGRGAARTRARRPVRLLYQEPHPDRASAQRREAALKRLTRAQKLAFLRGVTRASGSRLSPA